MTPPFCACCGVSFGSGVVVQQGSLCRACHQSPPVFHRARAALRYNAAARELVLRLKYRDSSESAAGLALLMQRAGADLFVGANMIVPVPLHARRLRQRRYNQAALLARSVAHYTGIPARLDLLQRGRPTDPLEGMSARARHLALQGAIMVRPGRRVEGQAVVLVDDVLTTGSTADQCAVALYAAGAALVEVLTLARVDDPRQP